MGRQHRETGAGEEQLLPPLFDGGFREPDHPLRFRQLEFQRFGLVRSEREKAFLIQHAPAVVVAGGDGKFDAALRLAAGIGDVYGQFRCAGVPQVERLPGRQHQRQRPVAEQGRGFGAGRPQRGELENTGSGLPPGFILFVAEMLRPAASIVGVAAELQPDRSAFALKTAEVAVAYFIRHAAVGVAGPEPGFEKLRQFFDADGLKLLHDAAGFHPFGGGQFIVGEDRSLRRGAEGGEKGDLPGLVLVDAVIDLQRVGGDLGDGFRIGDRRGPAEELAADFQQPAAGAVLDDQSAFVGFQRITGIGDRGFFGCENSGGAKGRESECQFFEHIRLDLFSWRERFRLPAARLLPCCRRVRRRPRR